MEIVEVEIDSLNQDPHCYRRHTKEGLILIRRNLELFDQYVPLIVRKSDNVILVGNAVWEVAKSIGKKTVFVIFLDVNEDQSRQISISDNRTAELSTWDKSNLREALTNIIPVDFLQDLSFDEKMLRKITESKPIKRIKNFTVDTEKLKNNTICCPKCGKTFEK